MQRRGILAALAGLVAGPRAVRAETVGRRALVIGAGAAGLAAGRALVDDGWQVTLLEARDRIGGRVHTSRLWRDLPIDLGASWIHGVKGNPLTALAKAEGVALSPQRDRVAILPKADARAAEDSFDLAQRIITSAQDAAKRLNRDISLKAAVERLPAWQGLTSDQRRLLDFHIVSAIEHEYAEDWDRLSAWWFDEADEHPGGDALIPEGYDRLLAPLARGIDIRLNTAVRRVGPAPEGVRAVLADGRTVTADAAVVAVPLAVLASGRVAVDGLAGRAEAALQALGTGLLNKVALRFDRAFWPADAGWVQHVPVRRGQFQEWVPLPGGTPAIMGFHAGSPARALEPLSDRDTAAEAVAALRSMLGSAVPDPLGVQVSRWQADAFALGSYSHYPVGATPDDRRALADVIGGRIVLAGEYVATDHPSTVHGAIQSGRRAARLL